MSFWWPFRSKSAEAPVDPAGGRFAEMPRFFIRQVSAHRWTLQEKVFGEVDSEWYYTYPFPAAGDCVTRQEAEAWMKSIVTGERPDFSQFESGIFGPRIWYDDHGQETTWEYPAQPIQGGE